MNLRAFVILVTVELRRFFRVPATWFWTLAFPFMLFALFMAYGLSGYVQSGSPEHAYQVASRLRTGNVHLNGAGPDFAAPFGGYKQSGNGREWGEFGFEDFLEVKAVMGAPAAA